MNDSLFIKSTKDIKKTNFKQLCDEMTNKLNYYYNINKWSVKITEIKDQEQVPTIGLAFENMNKYISIHVHWKYAVYEYNKSNTYRSIFVNLNDKTDILCKQNKQYIINFFSHNANDEWTSEEKQICISCFTKYDFEIIDKIDPLNM